MRLLHRYLAREVIFGTALVFAALVSLFSFFDFIHELNDLGKGSYQITQIVVYVLLAMPGHGYELFPIAALIGTLYGLNNLAQHSEITVMRASGMSKAQLNQSMIKIGLYFVLFAFVLGEFIVPATEEAAQQWRLKALNNFVATQFRSGIWVKDSGSFINVREMLPDNSLHDIRIYRFDDNRRLKEISRAHKATFISEHKWRLIKVEHTFFNQDGVSVSQDASEEWNSVLTPSVLSTLLVEPEQMSIWNLFGYIKHLKENNQQTSRFEIAQYSKLIYPFSILVMMMLAVPFSLSRPRSGAVGTRMLIGIALGLSFYLLSRFFAYLGQLNDWWPLFSTITPSLMFLLLAFAINRWQEQRL
ncbi:LPS export ABC transporter permease LptG [Ferrovum sp. PN-J185]|uniref:LPS export ABC transporter permease LptG n=1 Tax=Ferrovum sp. PN-J185 TaxID=1356306 RepID=UPI000795CCE9|nr:LPS export ABC transporter permease LptG [Ferrovum sp. PN-J185]KXW55284.1 lipopolysaccharide export system permease protein LptG [Ferrovum sp. PN-J185]MCC6068651.1 LPS export ABC transporter permease LptG [Ferrovum sp. PN-J185]